MIQVATNRIPTLDDWRAVAVCLVIAGHASPMLLQTAAGQLTLRLVSHAGVGVDVFFALSGFLICTLLLREKDNGGINLAGFYARRSFRIVPPIVVYLCVLLAVLEVSWSEVFASLFFFRNYVGGSWYTGHFWSLAVEEHFYLVIPALFLALSWSVSLRLALLAAACCILIRWIEWSLLDVKVEFRTEARFDGLMFGAVLALLMHRYSSLRDHLTLPVAAVVMVVAMALLIAFPAMPVRRTIVAMALPVLIGYTVLRPSELIGRMLEWRALRWIGRLSYSLYIWQMLFFVPVRDLPAVQGFPVALIGTVLCAVTSYYIVEKPMTAYGRRLSAALGRRRVSAEAQATDIRRIQ